MVVRSEKETVSYVWLCFLLLMIIALILWLGAGWQVWAAGLMLLLPSLFILLPFWVQVGKTLTFDQDGVAVCFLWLRKKYAWQELKVKRLETYPGATYKSPYDQGMVFSGKKCRKPSRMKPTACFLFMLPLSCIYVCFRITDEKALPDKKLRAAMAYPVDKDIFLDMLRLWQVEWQTD